MRNDTARWDVPAPLTLDTETWSVTVVTPTRQVLVSGVSAQAQYPGAVTWPEVAEGDGYALSLRRDQVLVMNDGDLRAGFDAEAGLALSDVTDGFVVVDLAGPGALGALQHGAELRLDLPSRSVLRRLFGFDVMLYRHGGEECFRLHIPLAHRAAFAAHLRAIAHG